MVGPGGFFNGRFAGNYNEGVDGVGGYVHIDKTTMLKRFPQECSRSLPDTLHSPGLCP